MFFQQIRVIHGHLSAGSQPAPLLAGAVESADEQIARSLAGEALVGGIAATDASLRRRHQRRIRPSPSLFFQSLAAGAPSARSERSGERRAATTPSSIFDAEDDDGRLCSSPPPSLVGI